MSIPSNKNASAAVPRHAATVMLLREAPEGVEVLLTRRHEKLAFMGGLWVFPGGALSPADTSAEALARIPEGSQARCARFADLGGHALETRQCLGLAVAAYRETFEETGLLLATSTEGEHCTDESLIRMREQRPAIVSHPELFASLLEEERLLLDVDRLTYWAHWITPSTSPRRFDTRFFVIPVPPGQTPAIDTTETVEHAWVTPAALLEAAASSDMPVSPPTQYTLMELDASLRAHGSLEALLAAEADRPVVAILPKMLRGTSTVVLPWDPQYQDMEGEGTPKDVEFPPALRNLPSRAVHRR